MQVIHTMCHVGYMAAACDMSETVRAAKVRRGKVRPGKPHTPHTLRLTLHYGNPGIIPITTCFQTFKLKFSVVKEKN